MEWILPTRTAQHRLGYFRFRFEDSFLFGGLGLGFVLSCSVLFCWD